MNDTWLNILLVPTERHMIPRRLRYTSSNLVLVHSVGRISPWTLPTLFGSSYPPPDNNTSQLPSTKMTKLEAALKKIDAAHSEDPRLVTPSGTTPETQLPYELHYANKMTQYLHQRSPNASETLQLAVRAQHLRRWEIPRSEFPQTKAGYHAWRAHLQKRQAEMAQNICLEAGYSPSEAERVAALVRKEGLKQEEDEETQVLEDVACLVFLDDRLEEFEKEHDEAKVVEILKKTLLKMSPAGMELAQGVVGGLSERTRGLVGKALEAD